MTNTIKWRKAGTDVWHETPVNNQGRFTFTIPVGPEPPPSRRERLRRRLDDLAERLPCVQVDIYVLPWQWVRLSGEWDAVLGEVDVAAGPVRFSAWGWRR